MTRGRSALREFELRGFAQIPGLLDPTAATEIGARVETDHSLSKGTRNLLYHDWCRDLATRIHLHPQLARVLPKAHVPVSAPTSDARMVH